MDVERHGVSDLVIPAHVAQPRHANTETFISLLKHADSYVVCRLMLEDVQDEIRILVWCEWFWHVKFGPHNGGRLAR